MAVTIEKLELAITEAERFLTAAHIAKVKFINGSKYGYHPKESGAVRRASMDLTRSLVAIRSSK